MDKIEINSTNEFHILRHFSNVDYDYRTTLIGKPYWYYDYVQKKYCESVITEDDIENALNTVGTKFFKGISGIENPKKLLGVINERFLVLDGKGGIKWTTDGDIKVASFSFGYSTRVGLINVLPKKSFVLGEIRKVKRSKCLGEDDVLVETVSGVDLKSTNMIYVEIVKTPLLPFCAITAFPDCSVNDLGDDEIVFVID
jgi:hypothetical protein